MKRVDGGDGDINPVREFFILYYSRDPIEPTINSADDNHSACVFVQ